MTTMLSEFEYFGSTPIQTQIRRSFYREFSPITALQHGAPITIVVPGADRLYLDLAKSYIIVRANIRQPNGANIVADTVGTINLPLHSMFSRVEIELNGKNISDPTNLYPYRSYLETLLTYDQRVQENQLQNSIWMKDTSGHMEAFDVAAGSANAGLVWRAAHFALSADVQMLGRIHGDIFHQNRAIPANIELRLRFIPSNDNFVLVTPVPGGNNAQVNYQLHINEIRLYVLSYEVTAENALAHARILEHTNARIPIRRVTMKHLSIAAAQITSLFDNVYLGILPVRLVVGLVTDASMGGGYQQNPFNFQNFGLNFLSLYVNGERVPNKPFEPNFATNHYIREYNSIFEGMGLNFSNKTIDIKRADYPLGYTLYVFDLTPDQNPRDSLNFQRTGAIRLEVKFTAALAHTTNILLYAEFDSFIEIDKYLNIITPF